MNEPGHSWARRYGVSVTALAICTIARLAISPLVDSGIPFLFFYPAIVVASWNGGFGPGAVATVAGACATLYFDLPPSLFFTSPHHDVVGMGIFVASGLQISALSALLARATRRAEAESQALAGLVSIVSHDVRSPLTVLGLQLELALKRAGADGQLAESIARAQRQVERLARLAEDLLDLSRIRAGRLELEPRTIDLARCVRESVAHEKEAFERAGCAVTVHAEEAVPGFVDRLRFDQIVTNLLTNAAKYGGGKPVEVTVERKGSAVQLVVRDQGIGIARDELRRIFEPFRRAVTGKQYEGSGLGLWIVRQLVEAMHGRVSVESELGNGATFVVELPAAAPASPVESAVTPREAGP
jgi:signal transduction histidine kinase